MGAARVLIPAENFNPSDGSANNAAPGFAIIKGTAADPKGFLEVWQFDQTTPEYVNRGIPMPQDYLAGGAINFYIKWMANAASGNSVVWAVKLGATTAADADTPVEHAFAAATTVTSAADAAEARRLRTATIAIAASAAALDGLTPGDWLKILFYRDAGNGADNLAADAELLGVEMEYAT